MPDSTIGEEIISLETDDHVPFTSPNDSDNNRVDAERIMIDDDDDDDDDGYDNDNRIEEEEGNDGLGATRSGVGSRINPMSSANTLGDGEFLIGDSIARVELGRDYMPNIEHPGSPWSKVSLITASCETNPQLLWCLVMVARMHLYRLRSDSINRLDDFTYNETAIHLDAIYRVLESPDYAEIVSSDLLSEWLYSTGEKSLFLRQTFDLFFEWLSPEVTNNGKKRYSASHILCPDASLHHGEWTLVSRHYDGESDEELGMRSLCYDIISNASSAMPHRERRKELFNMQSADPSVEEMTKLAHLLIAVEQRGRGIVRSRVEIQITSLFYRHQPSVYGADGGKSKRVRGSRGVMPADTPTVGHCLSKALRNKSHPLCDMEDINQIDEMGNLFVMYFGNTMSADDIEFDRLQKFVQFLSVASVVAIRIKLMEWIRKYRDKPEIKGDSEAKMVKRLMKIAGSGSTGIHIPDTLIYHMKDCANLTLRSHPSPSSSLPGDVVYNNSGVILTPLRSMDSVRVCIMSHRADLMTEHLSDELKKIVVACVEYSVFNPSNNHYSEVGGLNSRAYSGTYLFGVLKMNNTWGDGRMADTEDPAYVESRMTSANVEEYFMMARNNRRNQFLSDFYFSDAETRSHYHTIFFATLYVHLWENDIHFVPASVFECGQSINFDSVVTSSKTFKFRQPQSGRARTNSGDMFYGSSRINVHTMPQLSKNWQRDIVVYSLNDGRTFGEMSKESALEEIGEKVTSDPTLKAIGTDKLLASKWISDMQHSHSAIPLYILKRYLLSKPNSGTASQVVGSRRDNTEDGDQNDDEDQEMTDTHYMGEQENGNVIYGISLHRYQLDGRVISDRVDPEVRDFTRFMYDAGQPATDTTARMTNSDKTIQYVDSIPICFYYRKQSDGDWMTLESAKYPTLTTDTTNDRLGPYRLKMEDDYDRDHVNGFFNNGSDHYQERFRYYVVRTSPLMYTSVRTTHHLGSVTVGAGSGCKIDFSKRFKGRNNGKLSMLFMPSDPSNIRSRLLDNFNVTVDGSAELYNVSPDNSGKYIIYDPVMELRNIVAVGGETEKRYRSFISFSVEVSANGVSDLTSIGSTYRATILRNSKLVSVKRRLEYLPTLKWNSEPYEYRYGDPLHKKSCVSRNLAGDRMYSSGGPFRHQVAGGAMRTQSVANPENTSLLNITYPVGECDNMLKWEHGKNVESWPYMSTWIKRRNHEQAVQTEYRKRLRESERSSHKRSNATIRDTSEMLVTLSDKNSYYSQHHKASGEWKLPALYINPQHSSRMVKKEGRSGILRDQELVEWCIYRRDPSNFNSQYLTPYDALYGYWGKAMDTAKIVYYYQLISPSEQHKNRDSAVISDRCDWINKQEAVAASPPREYIEYSIGGILRSDETFNGDKFMNSGNNMCCRRKQQSLMFRNYEEIIEIKQSIVNLYNEKYEYVEMEKDAVESSELFDRTSVNFERSKAKRQLQGMIERMIRLQNKINASSGFQYKTVDEILIPELCRLLFNTSKLWE